MSSFSESVLEEKLRRLTSSQESIETLSLWIIHHKNNAAAIAQTWSETFSQAESDRKILLFYLINDVLQNSRRKSISVFSEVFRTRLKQATISVKGLKIQTSVERIIHIWRERHVYEDEYLDELDDILESGKGTVQKEKIDFKISLLEDSLIELDKFEGEMKIKSVALEQIPIDVSNTSSLSKLKDKSSGARFKQDFNNASLKLQEYVECTSIEVTERKNLLDMMKDCKTYHKQNKNELERLLKDYLQLQTHLESLSKKLSEKVDVLDKAQHTATSDPTSKTDITVVGDMEIDSDNEATEVEEKEEEPPVTTVQATIIPAPSFFSPTIPPPSSISPPVSVPAPSSHPLSLPISNPPFPPAPFPSFQALPVQPHPLPPQNVPPSTAIPYSPSMPKLYTPLAPIPPLSRPRFTLFPTPAPVPVATPPSVAVPSLITTPLPVATPMSYQSTPQSAPPTITEDQAFNQSKTFPDSLFHDYSDSDESDKPYSPSNILPITPDVGGKQATPSFPGPGEDNSDLPPSSFQFYGTGQYTSKEANQATDDDVVPPVVTNNSGANPVTNNSAGDPVTNNSSASVPEEDMSNNKPVIQPEDIKITPTLTNILGEIFPQLSKSLGEKRRGSPHTPNPAPSKLPRLNSSERESEDTESPTSVSSNPLLPYQPDYPQFPEPPFIPPARPRGFPLPQAFRPRPRLGFPPFPRQFPPPPPRLPPHNNVINQSGRGRGYYPHNQFQPLNNGRPRYY